MEVGDATETLQRLASRLAARQQEEEAERARWRADIEDQVRAWRKLSEERAGTAASPVNPELVVRELNGRLP